MGYITNKRINLILLSMAVLFLSSCGDVDYQYHYEGEFEGQYNIEASEAVKKEIQNQIDQVVNAVNKGDVDFVISQISPNAEPKLKEEIRDRLFGQSISFRQKTEFFEDLGDQKVKVTGKFSAAGPGWNIGGFPDYYIFENVDGNWMILETNFYKRLGAEYTIKAIGKTFLYVGIVLAVLSIVAVIIVIVIARKLKKDKIKNR